MLADVLLVIDLQNGICFRNGKIYNYDNLIKLVNQRIDDYYAEDKPIIFVQHNADFLVKNTPEWEIVPDLKHDKGSFFVDKQFPSAFYQTNLKQYLDERHIKSIEICGAETPFCIESTIQAANNLGYKLYMKKGATTTNYDKYMTVENTVKHYEEIWGHGNFFLTFLE
ncbi:cysteine hydrolase [Aggregatibacter actinomycetemcomitans]|nr:cysteine hydrolase [Aggregatibacter actinomycetemcomitans]